MRKRILISVAVFIIVSGVGFADDDNEVTKLVVSKGLGGGNSEIAYARNGRNLSSVIVWSQGSSTKFESKIYAALVKPKSNGTFKISKPRLISNKTDFNYKASIAFNEITNSYMVVWSSQVKNLDTHILGRKLSATGRPKGGIVKIAAEVNAQNSSPQIAPYYLLFGKYGPEKGRFILAYCKNWPQSIQNVEHGLHVTKLDASGRKAGNEVYLFPSAGDHSSGESIPLKIGNIRPVFGPYHFFTVTMRFYEQFDNVPKAPDTFLFLVGDVDDYMGPLWLYEGLYDPAQVISYSQSPIVTWVDSWVKKRAHVQYFEFGSLKGSKVRRPVRKEKTTLAFAVEMWTQCYLYNYGGGDVSVYRIGRDGSERKKVGVIKLPDPMGLEMKVYQGNASSKAILLTTVETGSEPYTSDVVLYYFNAPDWENHEGPM